MNTKTSFWTLTHFEPKLRQPEFEIKWPIGRATDLWEQAAREDHLSEVAALPDDWDGYGALAVSHEAVAHARTLLESLSIADNAPDLILPTEAGTVLFEWEVPIGSAHLEIGRSTFGFYTSPNVGEPIMIGGQIEVLDAGQILVALSTIIPRINSISLAMGDRRMGF